MEIQAAVLVEGAPASQDGGTEPGRARRAQKAESLAFSDLRMGSLEKGHTIDAGLYSSGAYGARKDRNLARDVAQSGVKAESVQAKGGLVVTGARLGATRGSGRESPRSKSRSPSRSREAAGSSAASAGLFNQKGLNAHRTAGNKANLVHANVQSQDQLGARRLHGRGAEFAGQPAGPPSGASSQIHIHDHVLSKSQGKSIYGPDALWKRQTAPGAWNSRGGPRARRLLVS